MNPQQTAHSAEQNFLLLALPKARHTELAKNIETLDLTAKTVLSEPGAPITSVYFPQSGFISVVLPLTNGSAVETMVVGSDGFVGLPSYFGESTTTTRAVIQGSGIFSKVPVADFLDVAKNHDEFRRRLNLYALLTLETICQGSACNRFHSVEQRCAKWLLISHDCMRENEFLLTQEFLAQMIGIRRPGVTVAAGALQGEGLIRYSRGRMEILDRKGLEKASCECYRLVKQREQEIFARA